jgi:hypothetical protein
MTSVTRPVYVALALALALALAPPPASAARGLRQHGHFGAHVVAETDETETPTPNGNPVISSGAGGEATSRRRALLQFKELQGSIAATEPGASEPSLTAPPNAVAANTTDTAANSTDAVVVADPKKKEAGWHSHTGPLLSSN